MPLWTHFNNCGTLRQPSSLRGGIRAPKTAPLALLQQTRRPQPCQTLVVLRDCSEKQKCNPASSNQTHERERADDLKPYGLNRREARAGTETAVRTTTTPHP